jgi:two-component system, cell cycle response regulator
MRYGFDSVEKQDMVSYRILIVDDEEIVREFLAALLSQHGHHAEEAQHGMEALDIINKNAMDAVVSDIVMPEMDGIALTRELRNLYPDLPVMVMTGYNEEYSAESAIAAGAREFIKKPFSNSEFITRFDKMMRDHQGEKALLTLSLTDELTGLYNRRRFFLLAEQHLKVAIRSKKKPLLLFFDMDHLKKINDHYGHNNGDQALVGFANILQKTFRESDIIARIGGDEFVALLETTDENSEMLINRLFENIKNWNTEGSEPYTLSISVGTGQFDPEHPILIDELLSKADASMYAQKRKKWKK